MNLSPIFLHLIKLCISDTARFIQPREVARNYDCDYVLIDTSPGIRYWSINALALVDALFLTLKFGEVDIDGTGKMASDIYGSFTKFGAKSYLLLSRVGGYCVPNTLIIPHSHGNLEDAVIVPQIDEKDLGSILPKEVLKELISAIPCYCDIQFN
jgi:chromosome partitioning protein